jgi:serine/threonine protein kinase
MKLLIAILITIFIVLTFYFLFCTHRNTLAKRKGRGLPSELAPTNYGRLFIVDGRLLILLGLFGDTLAKGNICKLDSKVDPNHISRFFQALHTPSITPPKAHLRVCAQLGGMFMDTYITWYVFVIHQKRSIFTIYGIKDYLVGAALVPVANLVLSTSTENYDYRTEHMNGKISTGKMDLGENDSAAKFCDNSVLPYSQITIFTNGIGADNREFVSPILIDSMFSYFYPNVHTIIQVTGCQLCTQFFHYLLFNLYKENTRLTAIPATSKIFFIIIQVLYCIGAAMIRLLYDGIIVKEITFIGKGSYNFVYDIGDDRVLRIYVVNKLERKPNFDGVRRISTEIVKLYNYYNSITPIINNELKTFAKIELCSTNCYNPPHFHTAGLASSCINFSFYLILKKYNKYDYDIYKTRIDSGEAIEDLRNISKDIIILFLRGYVFLDFKQNNIFMDATGKLVIIDVDISRFNEFIVSTYRLNNRNYDIPTRNIPNRCLSYSYCMFLIYIIKLFNNSLQHGTGNTLSEAIANEPSKYALTPIIDFDLFRHDFGINIFDYSYYIRYLVETHIDYLGKKKLDKLREEQLELVLADDITLFSLGKKTTIEIPGNVDSTIRTKMATLVPNINHYKLKSLLETMDINFFRIQLIRNYQYHNIPVT